MPVPDIGRKQAQSMGSRMNLARLSVVVIALAALTACGAQEETASVAAPDEAGLKASFSEQIKSVGLVRDFRQNGDEITFSGTYGREADATWRVRIDSAVIEKQEAQGQPYKGTVKSSWYVNGTLIEPRGTYADLPTDFLDKGVGQDCWAFWDPAAKRWGWT